MTNYNFSRRLGQTSRKAACLGTQLSCTCMRMTHRWRLRNYKFYKEAGADFSRLSKYGNSALLCLCAHDVSLTAEKLLFFRGRSHRLARRADVTPIALLGVISRLHAENENKHLKRQLRPDVLDLTDSDSQEQPQQHSSSSSSSSSSFSMSSSPPTSTSQVGGKHPRHHAKNHCSPYKRQRSGSGGGRGSGGGGGGNRDGSGVAVGRSSNSSSRTTEDSIDISSSTEIQRLVQVKDEVGGK